MPLLVGGFWLPQHIPGRSDWDEVRDGMVSVNADAGGYGTEYECVDG